MAILGKSVEIGESWDSIPWLMVELLGYPPFWRRERRGGKEGEQENGEILI